MLYSKAALAALLLSGEAYGFQPAVHAPLQQQRLAAAYRTVGPAVMNGIETVDFTGGSIRPQRDVTDDQMRPRPNIDWSNLRARLELEFGIPDDKLKSYDKIESEDLLKAYEMMQLCRQFENACNQAYMQGHIRGFMHLDNGQETIPAFVSDSIKKGDIKYSYYREHTHAIASGVGPGPVMAELFAKDTGTCRGTGGSMHIYDVDTHFQGGWALVSEQLPYAVGAARSIALDRHLGIAPEDDDRIAIVFCGEGGSQNGRMAECLNAAAKENLPILFICIDNGRAINTFTPDVAQNSDVFLQGEHYGVPGIKVDGSNLEDTLKTGRAVTDYVRTKGPAIMQVHTYRFQGHSPADPEHERGRKVEKMWARAECDPIKLFEATEEATSLDLATASANAKAQVTPGLECSPRLLRRSRQSRRPSSVRHVTDVTEVTASTLECSPRHPVGYSVPLVPWVPSATSATSAPSATSVTPVTSAFYATSDTPAASGQGSARVCQGVGAATGRSREEARISRPCRHRLQLGRDPGAGCRRRGDHGADGLCRGTRQCRRADRRLDEAGDRGGDSLDRLRLLRLLHLLHL